MRVDELEDMMNEEPDDAEAAIAELVSSGDVEELAHIARSARVSALKQRAGDALGQVGGPAATAALVELLEAANTPFLIGGTEQEIEHRGLRASLTQSLARARGVRPPDVNNEEAIAGFIEESRRS
jgi:HEAT repeat protein